MLNTLFIDDFIDAMEQYFHYQNYNWQCNSVAQTKDLYYIIYILCSYIYSVNIVNISIQK